MTSVLVLYYSSYGHIATMAAAVAEGVQGAGANAVVKRRVIGRCCSSAMPGRSGGASSWQLTSSGCGSRGRPVEGPHHPERDKKRRPARLRAATESRPPTLRITSHAA